MTIRVLHIDTEQGLARRRATGAVARRRDGAARSHGPSSRRGRANRWRAAPRRPGSRSSTANPSAELDPRAAWRLRREILTRRIDVVHAHTAHAVAVGALATLGTRMPLVVSRRVDFPLRENAGTRWKYGRAASIVAVSKAVANVLVDGGIARDRIAVVPDGVDLHRVVEPATAATLAAFGVAPNVRSSCKWRSSSVIRILSTSSARWRTQTAASANLQALLVGDGPLRDDVERRDPRGSACVDVVHLPGYRTDADALLAAADVACLSSREEGMGSVLLDALAFGRPSRRRAPAAFRKSSSTGNPGCSPSARIRTRSAPRSPDWSSDRALADRLAAARPAARPTNSRWSA